MTNTLLNISGKISTNAVAVFETVSHAIRDLNLPYVIVGATARDLVLHHGHGAKIERATRDVDFAIEAPNWPAFNTLKEKLYAEGFKKTKIKHRLISPQNFPVDIIPFGPISNDHGMIAWPPQGDMKMNVLGFQEACDNAEWVRIQDDPRLDIPVATPAGMVLLKIMSWMERTIHLRKKDALDVAYILSTYEKVQSVIDHLYSNGNSNTLEHYGWDVTLAAAHLLGEHAKNIAHIETRQLIIKLINDEHDELNLEKLTEEMCNEINTHYRRNGKLVFAFIAGFTQ